MIPKCDVPVDVQRMIDKAKAFIVLDFPFFATVLLKHEMIATKAIPTLGVMPNGTIYFNPDFIKTLTNNQLVWAICHEIMHYVGAHALRRGSRDKKRFNIAGDRFINDTLNRSGVGERIPGCEDVPGSADQTVEDIYAAMSEEGGGGGGGGGGGDGEDGGNGESTTGQDDDPLGQDVHYEGATGKEAELDAQRKIEVAEAAQVAKMKGKLPGILQKFAESVIEVKTPWYDILERYMTDRVKKDTNWARPNRRYAPDFYLPTNDSVGAMGEVVIQVDISGSVSPGEIRHYNGHMKRIIEQCRPSKVHVIYTDTQVQKHEEFAGDEEVQINFYSGGGTDMTAGFRYIAAEGIDPQVCITLTDGYTPWGDEPSFPTVHCISTANTEAPYGVNVHFEVNEQA